MSASERPMRLSRSQSVATSSSRFVTRRSASETRFNSSWNQGCRFSGSQPSSISRERFALRNASVNVRPIPIVSPTLFICVPSVRSAPGNFSKAKRGNLTTT